MKKNVHRRDFLKLSLAAAAAPLGVEALAAEKPPTLVLPPDPLRYSRSEVPLVPSVLCVPGGKTTLLVAVICPESPDSMRLRGHFRGRREGWLLSEVPEPDVRIPVEVLPAVGADGTAMERTVQLVAVIPPREGANDPRRFVLTPAQSRGLSDKAIPTSRKGFQFTAIDDKSLKLLDGDQPVLVYNHGTITNDYVPKDNPLRSRACYVHPLWGLNGEVPTDDFPKDHYHHHGVFWTWPHVGVDGKEHNLWAGDTIHDRFVRWIARDAGRAAAVLAVENGWFVGEKKVMIERVWMRVFQAADDARAIDFDFTWIPVDKPITLWGAEGKSYGGFTVRFAPGPREETLITVPSGPTKDDLPDTKLAWADFTSKFAGAKGRSGAAIFVHPSHPDYPPTWLTRYYGAMCVGWPGVKPKTFEPGKPIRLRYRLWIHKGPADVEQLKRAYAEYGAKKKVEWE